MMKLSSDFATFLETERCEDLQRTFNDNRS